MSAIASQITGVSIVCSGSDQRKLQISATLAFVRGIRRSPVNSPHKSPVTRKFFTFDDVIVLHFAAGYQNRIIKDKWYSLSYVYIYIYVCVCVHTCIL